MAEETVDVVDVEQASPAPTSGGGEVGQRRQQRQKRTSGGRHNDVHVRMSDEEKVQLSARAAAVGLTLPAWLVAAGMADRGSRGSGESEGRSLAGGSMSALERRAWAAEFVAVRRLARGVATNVNQLAAGYNSDGQVGTELHAVLEAARRVMDRMDDLGARLAGEDGDLDDDEDTTPESAPAGKAQAGRGRVRS